MSLTKVSYAMVNGAVFNVLDYGAVGDNINNDTTAIQAAIDAADTNGGGVVYLPADRTFRVTASLINKDNVTIRGEGYTSVIKSATNFKVFNQNTGVVAYDMGWENFRITGAATGVVASNHGINLFESERSTIRNMWIEELDGDGIYVRTNNVNIENIYCKNCYRQGIAVTNANYININNVRGEGTMISLVDIEPNVGDFINDLNINDVVFDSNTIPALRFYYSAVANDIINRVNVTNITSCFLGFNSVTQLTASNITITTSDTADNFILYLTNQAAINNVNIDGPNRAVQTKFKITSCEYVTVNNVVINGGADIDVDVLSGVSCIFNNLVVKGIGNVGIRLRDSNATVINGAYLSLATTYAILCNPTTALSNTILRNIVVESSNTGLFASGAIGQLYIDGNLDGATTLIDQAGVTSGFVSVGVLGSLYRNIYAATAIPTTGAWVRSDIVWNATPSSGGPPGWVCVASGTPGTWAAMANLA
jgi:polygalacturonase